MLDRREFFGWSLAAILSLTAQENKYFTGKSIENPPSLFAKAPDADLIVSLSRSDAIRMNDICENVKKDLTGILEELSKRDDLKLLQNAAKKTADNSYFFLTRQVDNWRDVQYPILSVQPIGAMLRVETLDADGLKKVIDAIKNNPSTDNKYNLEYSRYPWLEDALINTLKRYEDMGKGMKNFGITISANKYFDDRKIALNEWKQIDVDMVPKGDIITSGSFSGFIVLENADLFVPGVRFYKDVLNGDIKLESYGRLRYNFRDGLPDMKGADIMKVAEIADDLMAHDKLRSYNKAMIMFQVAEVSSQKARVLTDGKLTGFDQGYLDLAIKMYNRSLTYFPEMSESYYKLFSLYFQIGKTQDAITNIDKAIRYASPKDAKYYQNAKKTNLR